ncbi:MAG TPA: DUF2961 domain-containing protein [Puia sp.]|nr:DUF2961 domain-containing protein [Puia sp.]
MPAPVVFLLAIFVVAAVVDKWTWDKNSMYFHASYKYGKDIKDAKWDYDVNRVAADDTAAPIEWNFVKIRGRGIYLGNTLAVNNHMNSWYGEGDAKIWVDDDKFPFGRSFKYDLEMLSWNGGTIDAATTVYWYGAAGATEY